MSQKHYADTETALNRAAKLLRQLNGSGINLGPVLKNPRKAKNLARYIELDCPRIIHDRLEESSVYDDARFILGDDFITPEEMIQSRFAQYSAEDIKSLQDSLPNIDFLQKCKKKNHILLPSSPRDLRLIDIRNENIEFFNSQKRDILAGLEEASFFHNERTTPLGWISLHKGSLESCQDGSDDLTDVSVPNAADLSWMLIAFLFVRQVFLIEENFFVFTSSYCSRHAGTLYMGRYEDKKIRVGRAHISEFDDRRGFINSLRVPFN